MRVAGRHGPRPPGISTPVVILFGVAVYLAALAALAPATLLDAALKHASKGRLAMAEARGTLWSGSGRLQLALGGPPADEGQDGATTNDLPARRATLTRGFAWRLQPAALLSGRLAFAVDPAPPGKPLRLALAPTHLELSEVDLAFPAALLGAGWLALRPLQLSGEVRLTAPALTLGYAADHLEGGVEIQWRDAGSAFAPLSPFGAYSLRLSGAGNRMSARIDTLQGPLALTGEGAWAQGSPPKLPARISVPEPYRAQFTPFLQMFAVQRGNDFDLQLR
jgi:general secretion pathway protein N